MARSYLAGVVGLLLVIGMILGPFASTASAGPVPSVVVTITPPGPYVSGQLVTVSVAPNPLLRPGRSLSIYECGAAGPNWHRHCDPKTRQKVHLTAGLDGSASYSGYPIYALPDPVHLGEPAKHRPVCDLNHACVVVVSWDLDDAGHRVSSAPFLVAPNPGTGTPEVPSVVALPAIALAIFGGWALLRRRRTVSGPA